MMLSVERNLILLLYAQTPVLRRELRWSQFYCWLKCFVKIILFTGSDNQIRIFLIFFTNKKRFTSSVFPLFVFYFFAFFSWKTIQLVEKLLKFSWFIVSELVARSSEQDILLYFQRRTTENIDLESVQKAVFSPSTLSNQATGTFIFNFVAYPVAYAILGK